MNSDTRQHGETVLGREESVTTFGRGRAASTFSLLLKILTNAKIEPAVFLHGLGVALVGVEVSNLYIDKTCRVGSYFFEGTTYSEEICRNIYNGTFPHEQEAVQKTVAKVQMVTEIIKSVPCVFFALLMGPWSDKFGRRFLLVVSHIGFLFTLSVYIVNVYYFDQLVVEWMWLEALGALGGFYMTFWLGVYSYVSDKSTEGTRTIRIALCDAIFSSSLATGNQINGIIFERLDYYGNFGITLGLFAFIIVYTVVVLDDKEKEAGEKEEDESKNPFSMELLKESFGVAFRKRRHSMRHILVILIASYGVAMLVYQGVGSIEYLFIRKSVQWPEATDNPKFATSWYTQFRSYSDMSSLFFFFLVLPVLTNVFKMHDIVIVILVAACFIVYCSIFAFAKSRSLLYISIPFIAITNVITSPLRSSMTKIVGKDDIGKVFACVGAVGALTALAAPMYNLLYVATMDIYLSFYLLFTMAIFVGLILVLVYVFVHMKRVVGRVEKEAGEAQQDVLNQKY